MYLLPCLAWLSSMSLATLAHAAEIDRPCQPGWATECADHQNAWVRLKDHDRSRGRVELTSYSSSALLKGPGSLATHATEASRNSTSGV